MERRATSSKCADFRLQIAPEDWNASEQPSKRQASDKRYDKDRGLGNASWQRSQIHETRSRMQEQYVKHVDAKTVSGNAVKEAVLSNVIRIEGLAYPKEIRN